jgi:hypothetical protein
MEWKGIEEKGKNGTEGADLPANLRTPRFILAWKEWEQYKRERKESYAPTGRSKVLAALSRRGEPESVQALELSMEKGWMGPAEPDALGKNRKPSAARPGFFEQDPSQYAVKEEPSF